MSIEHEARPISDDELRQRAVRRLRKKSDFWVHVAFYVAINAFLVGIWAWSDVAFFWPIFPIFGWGIGVAANAWDAYQPDHIAEARIQREMNRLRR